MVPAWLSLAIVSVLSILFYDWVNQCRRGSRSASAMIVAVSQILILDVYFVLNGTRGIAAAGAGAVLLLVGWGVIGVVYGKLFDGPGRRSHRLIGDRSATCSGRPTLRTEPGTACRYDVGTEQSGRGRQ